MKRTFTLLAATAIMASSLGVIAATDVAKAPAAAAADSSVASYLKSYSQEAFDYEASQPGWVWNHSVAPNNFKWEVTDRNLCINEGAGGKATLSFNGSVIATVAADSNEMNLNIGEGDGTGEAIDLGGSLGPSDELQVEFKVVFRQNGTYTVTFDDNCFMLADGTPLKGTSFTYEYSYVKKEADLTYELSIPTGAVVKDLSEIKIKFSNASHFDYASGVVANLKSADGSINLNAYPVKIVKDGFTFGFGNFNTEWVSGEYTFSIYPNMLSVDDDEFYDTEEGNFPGLKAKYTLEAVAKPKLEDHYALVVPNSLNANRTNTANSMTGYGMQIIRIAVDGGLITVNPNCKDWVEMSYASADFEDFDGFSINPQDDTCFSITQVGASADDGLLEFGQSAATVNMLFPVWDDVEGDALKYRKEGTYTLNIPSGLLLCNDVPMKGLELQYTYKDEEDEFDFSYQITPNPAETLADASVLKEIYVTFNGCSSKCPVDYRNASKGGGYLYDPNGNEVARLTAYLQNANGVEDGKTIMYRFGNKNTEWIPGAYQFEIKKNIVAVGLPNYTDTQAGNFPGLTVVFTVVDNNPSSVAMIGVEKAESYTVVSLDGKVILKDATPAEILNLKKGLYIINGQKALLR